MPNKMNWMSKYPEVWEDLDKRYAEIENAYLCFIKGRGDKAHKDSFTYHTKVLFENGRIYCSKNAWNKIIKSQIFNPDELERMKKGEEQQFYNQTKVYSFNREMKPEDRLICEHVVPFNVIVEKFFENPTKDNFLKLHSLDVVCIITKEEDARLKGDLNDKMPADWDGKDIWARYKEAEIEIVK